MSEYAIIYLVLSSTLIFLLMIYLLYKIRNVHLLSYAIIEEVYNISSEHLVHLHQQIQLLNLLCRELDLEGGLPPTRGWAASPDFLLLISRHARENSPGIAVECGSGASTIVLARCLQMNNSGHLYSLDNDPEYARITRENLARYGLSDWATVIDAPLEQIEIKGRTLNWYSTQELPEAGIDLLIVDGPPTPMDRYMRYPAGPLLFPRLNSGGTVFLDDASRDAEREIVKMWEAEFKSLTVRSFPCEKGAVRLQLSFRKALSSSRIHPS